MRGERVIYADDARALVSLASASGEYKDREEDRRTITHPDATSTCGSIVTAIEDLYVDKPN